MSPGAPGSSAVPQQAELALGGPRGFRIRWWMWVVAGILLLLCLAIAVRIHGTIAFAETQAELKRMGFATTMEEFVAAGPGADADRQERLRRLMLSKAGWIDDIATAMPANDLQERRIPSSDLAKRDLAVRNGGADMAAVAAILAEGPVELSLFGWCERDPAKLRSIDVATAVATPLPHLLPCRAWANWWSIRACLDPDPEPHLQNLDRLVTAMGHPGTLIDAMIAMACSAIRDQAHLWLATRGRLPVARLQAWAAESPEHRIWCASGWAGERCVFQEPLSRLHWGFASLAGASGNPWDDAWAFVRMWPIQGHDSAFCASSLAVSEATLLGKPLPTIRQPPFAIMGLVATITLPNLTECGVTAIESANGHRLARCAAAVAEAYRRTGSLPEVIPAFASAAAIDANAPALLYERLSPSRFRIGIDPTGPLPPAIPTDRWLSKGYASTIGSPPAAPAALMGRGGGRWSGEIDLDAILIPPPEKPAKAKKP